MIADILTKLLQKCSLTSLVPDYDFYAHLSVWLVAMAMKKAEMKKNSTSQKPYGG